jgi:hypothetical protein
VLAARRRVGKRFATSLSLIWRSSALPLTPSSTSDFPQLRKPPSVYRRLLLWRDRLQDLCKHRCADGCGSNGVRSECPDSLMIRESGRRHGPIFGRVRAHWRPLEKATARSDAAGPPECPRFLSMKRRPAGHDVRICRAFVTLSGYVPGHSIRAAPCADLATTRSSARLPLAPAHRGMKMAFEGSVRLGPNVWFIRDRGLLWENADG